jgi:integrase
LRLASSPKPHLAGHGLHHTPHSLRHSFASILLSKGKPILYVKDALGHASIQMTTVDTYGSWLPIEAPSAVDVLGAALRALGNKWACYR